MTDTLTPALSQRERELAPELELLPSHVIAARRGIAPYLRHTPLEPNASLSKLAGSPVLLKLENLQVTGSFKPRGSLHKVLSVRASRPDAGFIAPTAGGHGIGLAYAAEPREAMRWCVTDTQYILEPSAAAGLAALRKLLPRELGPTVVVLTGRNVSWRRFEELVRG